MGPDLKVLVNAEFLFPRQDKDHLVCGGSNRLLTVSNVSGGRPVNSSNVSSVTNPLNIGASKLMRTNTRLLDPPSDRLSNLSSGRPSNLPGDRLCNLPGNNRLSNSRTVEVTTKRVSYPSKTSNNPNKDATGRGSTNNIVAKTGQSISKTLPKIRSSNLPKNLCTPTTRRNYSSFSGKLDFSGKPGSTGGRRRYSGASVVDQNANLVGDSEVINSVIHITGDHVIDGTSPTDGENYQVLRPHYHASSTAIDACILPTPELFRARRNKVQERIERCRLGSEVRDSLSSFMESPNYDESLRMETAPTPHYGDALLSNFTSDGDGKSSKVKDNFRRDSFFIPRHENFSIKSKHSVRDPSLRGSFHGSDQKFSTGHLSDNTGNLPDRRGSSPSMSEWPTDMLFPVAEKEVCTATCGTASCSDSPNEPGKSTSREEQHFGRLKNEQQQVYPMDEQQPVNPRDQQQSAYPRDRHLPVHPSHQGCGKVCASNIKQICASLNDKACIDMDFSNGEKAQSGMDVSSLSECFGCSSSTEISVNEAYDEGYDANQCPRVSMKSTKVRRLSEGDFSPG